MIKSVLISGFIVKKIPVSVNCNLNKAKSIGCPHHVHVDITLDHFEFFGINAIEDLVE